MTFKTKRLWALLMALAMLVGVMGTALAAEKYSDPVNLKGRIVRPQQPTPPPTGEEGDPQVPGEPTPTPIPGEPTPTPIPDEPTPGEPAPTPGEPTPGEPLPTPTPEPTPEPAWEVVTEKEDGKVNLRSTPEIAEGNIIAKIPRGARLTVLEREGDWVKVVYNGQEGYVNARFVSEVPAEPEQPDEEEEPTEVPFESKYQRGEDGKLILDENGNPIPLTPVEGDVPQYKRDKDGNLELDENGEPVVVGEEEPVERSVTIFSTLGDVIEEGDPITLSSVLTGFDGVKVEYQWQYRTKGAGWKDMAGATEASYTFSADPGNVSYEWRLLISFDD